MTAPVLAIESLTLTLPGGADRPHAITDLSLTVAPGETLCVVGESGSGKSLTALATIGLLPAAVKPALVVFTVARPTLVFSLTIVRPASALACRAWSADAPSV